METPYEIPCKILHGIFVPSGQILWKIHGDSMKSHVESPSPSCDMKFHRVFHIKSHGVSIKNFTFPSWNHCSEWSSFSVVQIEQSLFSLCFTLSLESTPLSLRHPHSGTSSSISDSTIPSSITFSFDSPLCSSITPSLFHSRLKTYLFHKFYPRSFTSSSRTAFTDFCPDRFFWATRFFVF